METINGQPMNHDQLLGQFKSDITHIQDGLKRAETLIDNLTTSLNDHSARAEERIDKMKLELSTLRTILKNQTDRVTDLMEVTTSNALWLQTNAGIVQTVSDHEGRLTDLEHNRTFVKGIIWLAGIALGVFGLTPLFKYLIEYFTLR